MRIVVKELPPVESSPNWRGHWSQRYRAAKRYQEAVYYECVDVRNSLQRQPGAPPFHAYEKARLDLTFVFPQWRGRDEDNLRASFKPGQDAMVQAGLIVDDKKENLTLGEIKVVIDRCQGATTIIELEEME